MAASPSPIISCQSPYEAVKEAIDAGYFVCLNGPKRSYVFHRHTKESSTGGCTQRTVHTSDLLHRATVIFFQLDRAAELNVKLQQNRIEACRCSLRDRVISEDPSFRIIHWTFVEGLLFKGE